MQRQSNVMVLLLFFVVISGIALFLSAFFGQARAQSPVRWEYSTVIIESRMQGVFGDPSWPDDGTHQILATPAPGTGQVPTAAVINGNSTVVNYLNAMGAEGWELVTYNPPHCDSCEYEFVFKRPIP